ncbi:MAG: ribbon-helix-helix protein, CopG family [Rhizobiales bacterium]|nr:ribbon-helix-helix protein, CopG family [Hyphomicrobiales bacterium]MBI3672582.1 ribbon-helix-helix protein, CopG family [Hyphomicrobiales bacterium]
MKQSISVDRKKRRGRPATGRDPAVSTRLPESMMEAVDRWASSNNAATRAEAIRRLVELGLKAKR